MPTMVSSAESAVNQNLGWPAPKPPDLSRAEHTRRTLCQQAAFVFAMAHAHRPWGWIAWRTIRRWPASCTDPVFLAELRRRVDREQRETDQYRAARQRRAAR